jgi:outer membrane protein
MRTTTLAATLTALAGLGLTATVARADDAPVYDNQIRAGLYYLYFRPDASDITGPFIPSNEHLNISLDDVATLYLAYIRRVSTHFDLELALGYPPLTKTRGSGPATVGSVPYNNQVIATARWFSPSLLLLYQFFDDSHDFHPFIGAGINYTNFYSRQSTAAGNAVSGGPTSISLPSSVGAVGTVGLSYRFSNRFNVNVSYDAAQIRSKLTANTAGIIRTSDINFGVRAVVVSFGFLF